MIVRSWFGFRGYREKDLVPNPCELLKKITNKKLNKSHKFLYYWFPILVYCLLIFFQSSYPSPEHVPDLRYMDKLLHILAYALLGALFLRALNSLRIKNNLKLVMILSVLFSSLYGVSDEIHQYFVPYRNADLMDILADMLGSIIGVYIYHSLVTKYQETTKPGF